MPIACTSETTDRRAPCAAPTAVCLSGTGLGLTRAADAGGPSDFLISVFQPPVRHFSAAYTGLTDISRNSGRVRCSPGLFRHRKWGRTSPHFRKKSRNSGQNTSQRTQPKAAIFLIGCGARPLSAAPGADAGRPGLIPDRRSRAPPGEATPPACTLSLRARQDRPISSSTVLESTLSGVSQCLSRSSSRPSSPAVSTIPPPTVARCSAPCAAAPPSMAFPPPTSPSIPTESPSGGAKVRARSARREPSISRAQSMSSSRASRPSARGRRAGIGLSRIDTTAATAAWRDRHPGVQGRSTNATSRLSTSSWCAAGMRAPVAPTPLCTEELDQRDCRVAKALGEDVRDGGNGSLGFAPGRCRCALLLQQLRHFGCDASRQRRRRPAPILHLADRRGRQQVVQGWASTDAIEQPARHRELCGSPVWDIPWDTPEINK